MSVSIWQETICMVFSLSLLKPWFVSYHIVIPKPGCICLADLTKRQMLIESGKQYAERYHSALTEFRVLGQALALLRDL